MQIRHWVSIVVLVGACGSDSSPAGPIVQPPSNAIASLEIIGTKTAEVGQTTKLSVEARNSSGTVVTAPSVSWSTSDNSLIAVAADGTVSPVRIGSVNITATSGTISATTAFTSSLAPYTFVFSAGTSASDQQLIRDGILNAHLFHKAQNFRPISQPTTVSGVTSAAGCSGGGAAAFTGAGAVTFCLANPGWINNGPVMRQKIVQHELFHVWQFEKGWISNPATAGSAWVIEGSAELMGFKGIEAKGLLPIATAIGCQVKESTDFAKQVPPGLPSLQTVETRQAFQSTIGPLYTHSMLAMDRLIGTNLIKLQAYGDAIAAGTVWQTSFNTNFATTPTAFYPGFASYLSSLPIPPTYQCGI